MTLATSGFDPAKGSLTSQRLFDPGLNDRVNQMITQYANSPSVPKHAKGNMVLMNWVLEMHLSTRIPPMALINGTFDPGGGMVGMTAQLCLTILQATGTMIGEPQYELVGDWNKVRGKHKVVEGEKDGKKYKFAAADYTPKDEQGLGMRVTIQWADMDKPITYPQSVLEDGTPDAYWMRDCYPRNSTIWATDPLQQMKYFSLRRVARTARPAALNGMSIASEDDVYHGFDNAKTVNTKPSTPDENLDDLSNFDDGVEDMGDGGGYVDADGVVHDDDETHNQTAEEEKTDDGKLIAWLSFQKPSWEISKTKLEKLLQCAIQNAEDIEHLLDIVNKNGHLIRDHLGKPARERLKTLQDEREIYLQSD